MTDRRARLVQISKLMSLILRHEPGRFGVILDAEGYVPLAELIAALRSQTPDLVADDVLEVVQTLEPDKCRFNVEDGEIRASYGHSFSDRIVHSPSTPPELLWHGTSDAAMAAIRVSGLLPMRRQYVHLSVDPDLARRIGARHGAPRVLRVEASRAFADGVAFYRANDSFWLADTVPARYLSGLVA